MMDEIFYSINKEACELLPVSRILNKREKQHAIKLGYPAEYTADEWKQEFPFINVSNVYLSKNIATYGTIYYDKAKYIVLNLNMVGSQIIAQKPKDEYEQEIVSAIKHLEQYYDEKKYAQLLVLAPDIKRMEIAKQMILAEAPSADLYSAIILAYTTTDYVDGKFASNDWKIAFLGKSQAQKDITYSRINSIVKNKISDNSEITIYRGEANKSTPYTLAYSWTTDYDTAMFFAARRGKEGAKIISAKIHAKDIYEVCNDANECEVIAMPGTMYDITVENLVSIEDITSFDEIERYKKYKNTIRQLYNWTHGTMPSEHDAIHSARVLFYALLILQEGKIKLTEEEKDILCTAIAWHDTGRINDSEDIKHGLRATHKYLTNAVGNPAFNNTVGFLVKYHCVEDSLSKERLLEMQGLQTDSVWKLYEILKDADALDRVRFGLQDLDTKYLRLDVSHKLIPIAVKAQDGISL